MSIRTISHKGKSVLLADFSSCTSPDEIIAVLDQVEVYMKKQPDEEALLLADMNNASLNPSTMDHAKNLAKRTFNRKIKKVAALGMVKLKKILLNGYNLVAKVKVVPFDSQEEALDYLTS